MAVSGDTIDKIKQLPVSSILEKDGAHLKRIGREYVTNCLWHKDKNPSLTISDDKGFVFCHVCQHHDDGIGYVQKRHGLNFREACEKIATDFNLQVVYEDENNEGYQKLQQERSRLYELAEKQQDVYRNDLKSSPEVIHFIQNRAILPETSRYFGLGFDKKERRLTIPICNHQGRIVGFTGRAIDPEAKPKYKNTENNLIFVKQDLVFNEDKASDAIREAEEIVFVEGHLDVVAMHQAGVSNTVAIQGTSAPSHSVISRLVKKSSRFILCLDSDDAGRKAMARFLETVKNLSLSGSLDLRIASLPDGMDPDDFIKSGGDIKSVISNAIFWIDWILDQWLNELDFDDKPKIQLVENEIRSLVSQISSPALRAHYFDKAAIRLAQNKQALAAEIAKNFHATKAERARTKAWHRPDISFTRKLVEKRLVRLYIHRDEYRWLVAPMMQYLTTPSLAWLWNRIVDVETINNSGNLADCLMAILSVSDSTYMQQLRSVVRPSVLLDDNELSVMHIEDIMTELAESEEKAA